MHPRFAHSSYPVRNIAIIEKISQNVTFSVVFAIRRERRAEKEDEEPRSSLVKSRPPTQINTRFKSLIATAIHLRWWGMRALSKANKPFNQPELSEAHRVATLSPLKWLSVRKGHEQKKCFFRFVPIATKLRT